MLAMGYGFWRLLKNNVVSTQANKSLLFTSLHAVTAHAYPAHLHSDISVPVQVLFMTVSLLFIFTPLLYYQGQLSLHLSKPMSAFMETSESTEPLTEYMKF